MTGTRVGGVLGAGLPPTASLPPGTQGPAQRGSLSL